MSTYDLWSQGTISDVEAFAAIAAELEEIEPHLKRAEDAKRERRLQLETIVKHAGGKINAAGYEAIVTQPARVAGYDVKKLDQLAIDLMQRGYLEVAQEIALCRTESNRSGYLKLARAK